MTTTQIDRDTDCRYCGFPRHAHWGTRPIVAGRCPGFKAVEVKAAPAALMVSDATDASPMRAALEAAEHWIEEQAWSPIAENGEILRTIRGALGKPHDAPDAAPAAPQTPMTEFMCIGAYDDGERFAAPITAPDAETAETLAKERYHAVNWAGFVALRDGVMTVEG